MTTLIDLPQSEGASAATRAASCLAELASRKGSDIVRVLVPEAPVKFYFWPDQGRRAEPKYIPLTWTQVSRLNAGVFTLVHPNTFDLSNASNKDRATAASWARHMPLKALKEAAPRLNDAQLASFIRLFAANPAAFEHGHGLRVQGIIVAYLSVQRLEWLHGVLQGDAKIYLGNIIPD